MIKIMKYKRGDKHPTKDLITLNRYVCGCK